MTAFLEQLYLMTVGLGVAGGLLFFMSWRHSHFWRDLETAYPGGEGEPLRRWHMQSVYFYRKNSLLYTSHRGFVTIGLTETGILFQTMPPVSFLQKPIFVPYSDLTIYGVDWLLMGRCCQLEFHGEPELKMVIPGEVGDLLLDYTHPLFVAAERPGLSESLAILR